MQDILEGLNEKQHEAVINTEGPCLVIARSWKRKNKSFDTQNSIFNTRKKCKTMGYISDNIYKQGSK